ncbi:MAG: hypothetical protein KDE51_23130, partial [Anaerolineales bacterium]|nr:hypothetical protein [Anaerolineales bacterium]
EMDQPNKAQRAYEKAIALNPADACSRAALAGLYRQVGNIEAYREQIEQAQPLIAMENEYNRACFAAISGQTEEAVKLLRQAIKLQQVEVNWAQRDPDFQFIRQDPRYRTLVGLPLAD